MKVLVISTIYRCVERIAPVIELLSRDHVVDIIHLGEMSPHSGWPGDIDLRQQFYVQCENWCGKSITGPNREYTTRHYRSGDKLLARIDPREYDVVLMDDNLCKTSWGFQGMYEYIKAKNNIPVIGSPHGNREMRETFVRKNWKRCFDASFVLGEKERSSFARGGKMRKSLIPGGIPSNDILSTYPRRGKYILVIVGFVKGINVQKGYAPFTEQSFLKSGVLDVQQKYGCPIIVKEKSTFVKGSLALKSLRKYRDVSVIMDVEDDNQLIADAKCVVAAASTLCFKPIQLGIPTAILRGYGMLGNFADFDGTVPCAKRHVLSVLDDQFKNGKKEKWVLNTLEGGLDFSSTQKYVDYLVRVGKRR